ncbi:restriction endonuclease [Mycoplasmatota bacterium WC30]
MEKKEKTPLDYIDDYYLFLLKKGIDQFQATMVILTLIGLPISWILGFSAQDGYLLFKVIFVIIVSIDIICIIYTIMKIKKKINQPKPNVHNAKKNIFDFTKIRDIDGIDSLGNTEFELYVAYIYKKLGYGADHVGQPGDDGADVIAYKGSDIVCIQAKHYSSNIGPRIVKDTIIAMPIYNCNKACIVTNSRLTAHAERLANNHSVKVIDRYQLIKMLQQNII